MPSKLDNFSNLDKLSSDDLYIIVNDSLKENNIDEAWQAVIRIIEKDV